MARSEGLTRFTMELVTAGVTGLAGAVVVVGAREFGIGWGVAGPEPGYFPFYIGIFIILGSLGTVITTLVRRHRERRIFLDAEQARRIAIFCGPMLGFVIAAGVLGLYVATALYLFGVMRWQGGYKIGFATLVSVGTAVAFYFIFDYWFQVPLLKGPILNWLGIY
jgi:sterol desaturase/sphingolipid hydroxylase (fatty acid hydroxylase superfamily)